MKFICLLECLLQDYHVILLYSKSGSVLVYDFDTTLTFPCDAQTYWTETFRPELNLNANYHRYVSLRVKGDSSCHCAQIKRSTGCNV